MPIRQDVLVSARASNPPCLLATYRLPKLCAARKREHIVQMSHATSSITLCRWCVLSRENGHRRALELNECYLPASAFKSFTRR